MPKRFWALWKYPDARKYFIKFRNFYVAQQFGQITKVEQKIFACPKSQATWKNLSKVPEILGQIEKIYSSCPKKSSMSPPIHSRCSLKSREYNATLEALGKNIRGDNFNLLKSFQGVKLTSLFHVDLIPNLGKLKIFSPRVKISPTHLSVSKPKSHVICQVNFYSYPFCVNGIALGLVQSISLSPLPPWCESS